MKKSMKAIIAAATVVSLVCIGTVSYAAWSSGNVTEVSVTGSTALISSISGVTATPDSASGTLANGVYTMNKLVPIDHLGTASGTVKYWKFTLSCDVTGNQTFTYTVSGKLTKSGEQSTTWSGNTGLYWSTSTPMAGSGNLIGSTAANITFDGDSTDVYIFLEANTVDAMNANITITFGAV